jgi:hypothetical protein
VLATDSAGVMVAWKGCGNTLGFVRMDATSGIVTGWASRAILSPSAAPPALCSDGGGGAFLAWGSDGHVAHVAPNGNFEPHILLTGVTTRVGFSLLADGVGGACLAWQQGVALERPHVLRLGPDCLPYPGWPAGGVELTTARTYGASYRVSTSGPILTTGLATDGLGGAYVSWIARDVDDGDVYVQHVTGGGVRALGWPDGGLAIAAAPGLQNHAALSPDGSGGVFVTWEDASSRPAVDLFASHRLADGRTLDPPGGITIAASPSNETEPFLAGDGAGGTIVTWMDDAAPGPRVRVARIASDGVVATFASVVRAAFENHRVRVVWRTQGLAGSRNAVERRADGGHFIELAVVTPDGSGDIDFADDTAVPGVRYAYRLTSTRDGHVVHGEEAWVSVPLRVLALAGATPNPAGPELRLSFTLPDDSPARLDVVDVAGRIVFGHEVGTLGAGEHVVDAGRDRRLSPGLYLVRLTRGSQSLLRRAIVVR